jgi:hypothetical protein
MRGLGGDHERSEVLRALGLWTAVWRRRLRGSVIAAVALGFALTLVLAPTASGALSRRTQPPLLTGAYLRWTLPPPVSSGIQSALWSQISRGDQHALAHSPARTAPRLASAAQAPDERSRSTHVDRSLGHGEHCHSLVKQNLVVPRLPSEQRLPASGCLERQRASALPTAGDALSRAVIAQALTVSADPRGSARPDAIGSACCGRTVTVTETGSRAWCLTRSLAPARSVWWPNSKGGTGSVSN